jgi:2-polyprenyl-3-methyl-5-hydroxy-6-metoxy-1,4-benzoquinol methylase
MSSFDEAYYERFYRAKKTRVSSPAQVANLCEGVVGMIRWYGADLASVLDVGAGVGLWRDWFKKHAKGVKYRSTEISDYACAKYGHEKRDIATWRGREKFDLVVCQGVLPYLDDAAAGAALENLAAMTRGFLYLEAITQRDLEDVCDRDLTDVRVHERPGSFYLSRLDRHFTRVGCGLFYKKDGPLVFYELESLV